jgi:hypothetical protein
MRWHSALLHIDRFQSDIYFCCTSFCCCSSVFWMFSDLNKMHRTCRWKAQSRKPIIWTYFYYILIRDLMYRRGVSLVQRAACHWKSLLDLTSALLVRYCSLLSWPGARFLDTGEADEMISFVTYAAIDSCPKWHTHVLSSKQLTAHLAYLWANPLPCFISVFMSCPYTLYFCLCLVILMVTLFSVTSFQLLAMYSRIRRENSMFAE